MEQPIIFSKFEREINGKPRKFWIQLLPDDQKQLALELFGKYFIRDEPICKSLKILQDEECMQFCREFWSTVLEENTSLACFTELDDGQIQLVAVNFCCHGSTDEKKHPDLLPEKAKILIETLNYMSSLKDISKELGITEYLAALGLLVIPEYRGYNIGLQILNARKMLCHKLGLKASITNFTAPASQKLAEKAGFKDLVSVTYDDLEKMRPDLKFPNINEYSKCVRYMYIMY